MPKTRVSQRALVSELKLKTEKKSPSEPKTNTKEEAINADRYNDGTINLPNASVSTRIPVTRPEPSIESPLQEGKVEAPPKSLPQPSIKTTPVTLSELIVPVNVSEDELPVIAPVNPFLGSVPDFANSFKFSRQPTISAKDYVLSSRNVGFIHALPNIVLPSGWGVPLIEMPEPLISVYSMSIFNELGDESGFSVQLDKDVDNLLLQPVKKAFRRGTNLAFFQLNEELFVNAGVDVKGGSVTGPSFVAPFILSKSNDEIQCNVTQLVTGAIDASIVVIFHLYGLLVLDKKKIHSTSGIQSTPAFQWLQNNWFDLQIPNPVMIKGLLGLKYVDDSLTHSELFRYGKVSNMVLGPNNMPLVTKWDCTYDNVTVELLGIAQRDIRDRSLTYDALINLVDAHAPRGSVFETSQVDQRAFRPIVMLPPDIMISQLFMTIAKQPSIKTAIIQLYLDAISYSSIAWVAPMRDPLTGLTGNVLAADLQREFFKRVGTGSYESLMEGLSYEIRPTFDFCVLDKQRPVDRAGQFMCLLETLCFFILFPKAAKFGAYELANRIRYIMRSISPTLWAQYTSRSGYWYNRPNTDAEISRESYLSNEVRPSLLYGPAANQGWDVMEAMSQLITPIGEFVPRQRAEAANLPIFDSQIFVPWDDVGDGSYDGTQVTQRILRICDFMNNKIIPLFKNVARQSSAQLSGYGSVCANVISKANRVGNGLGRGFHRLFCGMVDYATNVIHSYDGQLDTDIPRPIYLFDNSINRSVPIPVQSWDSNYQVATGIVWMLVYHTEYVFDSSYLLNEAEESEPVYSEMESPVTVMNGHLSIYAYAELACIGPGIANEILDVGNQGRPPYTFIHSLLKAAKVSGQVLTSGAYKRLERLISSRLGVNVSGHSQSPNLPDINVMGDERYADAIFRRAHVTKVPVIPAQNDPPVIQGKPMILTPVYREMFEYMCTVLLDPQSALARVMTGFALCRVTSSSINFFDSYIPPNLPLVHIDINSFPTRDSDRSFVRGLLFENNFYTDIADVPDRIFQIESPGQLPKSALEFLCNVMVRSRSVLVFPNLKFIYTLQVTDKIGYDRIVAALNLVELCVQATNSVAHVTLYSTYQVSQRLTTSTGKSVRYFFPLSVPNVNVAFKDIVELEQEPTYMGPKEAVYDSGNLNEDWRNTYSNGIAKSYTSLSIANEIIVREKGEHFYEFPQIGVTLPSQLSQYEGNIG